MKMLKKVPADFRHDYRAAKQRLKVAKRDSLSLRTATVVFIARNGIHFAPLFFALSLSGLQFGAPVSD